MNRPAPRIFVMVLALLAAILPACARAQDPSLLLRQRDGVISLPQLERAVGGEEALIRQLLDWRENTTQPFIGVRAQKLLLRYADRPEVESALARDLAESGHHARIRTVVLNLGTVAKRELRQKLARLIVERARSEGSFREEAKLLLLNPDAELQREARRLGAER